MDEPLLMIPGPTPLPPEVREAMARPMISHRSPEFVAAHRRVRARLQAMLGTAGEAVVMPGSGTGALEAAVVNVFSPGDRVVVAVMGQFGERFLRVARAFGLQAHAVEGEWGRALPPERVAAAVTPDTRGVLVTYSETSTGALLDLAGVAAAVRARAPEALVLADAVSALGGVPVAMDDWGVDVVCAGAQKALMGPPGLAVLGVGPRALAAGERATLPRLFWDFRTYIERARAGGIAYTPAIPLVLALDAALERIAAEGLANVYRRHREVAARCRAGLRALGFAPVAPDEEASPTVTAVRPPAGLQAAAVIAGLLRRGVEVASALGRLEGQAFRVGHMGYVGAAEVDRFLAALAEVARATA